MMDADPDTLINSVAYKKISEYNNLSGQWEIIRDHFVRSDSNGIGYCYLPDSLAEFKTGNVSAQAGDTVHDVLWSTSYSGGWNVSDFVCDSVITLSNDGVTVSRHYVSHPIFQQSQVVFWQAGMGASSGPSLRLSGRPFYASVEAIVQFNQTNDGLPGGPAWCTPLPVGIENRTSTQLTVGPNPSTGAFVLSSPNQVLQTMIFDPQGREILRTRESSFDLSRFAPGLYTAVVTTTNARQTIQLVLQR
jgi:hypothetical protein